MAMSIPASVQALYPKSARGIVIRKAWRPTADGKSRPDGGPDGWTSMHSLSATYANLVALAEEGYTWVNFQASGVAGPFQDAPISTLI